MTQIEKDYAEIDSIRDAYPADSLEYKIINALHGLLIKSTNKLKPEALKAGFSAVKEFMAAHKAGDPALYADMKRTVSLYFQVVTAILDKTRTEGAGEGASPTLEGATNE